MSGFQWAWRFAKPWKFILLSALILMFIESFAAVARTGIQQWIIDDVFVAGTVGKLPIYLSIMGVALILPPILFTVIAMICHYCGHQMRGEMWKYLAARMVKMPISVLQQERTAKLQDYLTRDVSNACEDISYQIPKGIQQAFTSILLMIYIGFANLYVLCIVVLFAACYVGIGRYFTGKMKAASHEVMQYKSELSVVVEEGIAATREVVAFHRESWERNRYDTIFNKYYRSVIQEGKLENRSMFWSDPLRWGATVITLAFGGYQVFQGHLTLGTFVVIFQLVSELVASFQSTFDYAMKFPSTMASAERLRKLDESEQDMDGDIHLQTAIHQLRLKQLSFSYSADLTRVLNEVTLDIPVGEKVAIVGRSGSGKSTITKLLVRYYDSQIGSIEVNGLPLSSIKRDDWSAKLGVSFQESYLFPDTIRNNIVFGRSGVDDETLYSICRKMQIHSFITSLPDGYETIIGERGVTLSGGQRQRISLARAVLCDPEVLLLDEATSALDLETERSIQAELDMLRQGRTTIIIAHRLSTVRNANLIYVMDRGEILEKGTHDSLMLSDTLYRSLVNAEIEQSKQYV